MVDLVPRDPRVLIGPNDNTRVAKDTLPPRYILCAIVVTFRSRPQVVEGSDQEGVRVATSQAGTASRASRARPSNARAVAPFLGIAVGAGAAATVGRPVAPSDERESTVDLLAADASADIGGGTDTPSGVLPVVASVPPPHDDGAELAMSEKIRTDRVARAAAQRAQEEARNRAHMPVQGRITSNYGPRWGTTHHGLDIANRIGTPIVAPTAGVVLDAGPASGFGLWVRIRHDDGAITVYGHIDSYAVRDGQRVEAGEVIATVGNRGRSTGPHLHFEAWEPGGRKVNPLTWLRERGVRIG